MLQETTLDTMSEINPKNCTKLLIPVRDTLDMLNGKWKILIITSMINGSKRFKELQRDVVGITAKMLSKELKELELNKLVTRTVHHTSPVTVEYALTDYSYSLKKVIEALYDWGVQHRAKIMA